MTTTCLPAFPHRHNSDGSFDSICAKCFATVANSKLEGELEEPEKQHVCDPSKVALLQIPQMNRC